MSRTYQVATGPEATARDVTSALSTVRGQSNNKTCQVQEKEKIERRKKIGPRRKDRHCNSS